MEKNKVLVIIIVMGIFILIVLGFIDNFWEEKDNGIIYNGDVEAGSFTTDGYCYSDGKCYTNTLIIDMTPNENNTFIYSHKTYVMEAW